MYVNWGPNRIINLINVYLLCGSYLTYSYYYQLARIIRYIAYNVQNCSLQDRDGESSLILYIFVYMSKFPNPNIRALDVYIKAKTMSNVCKIYIFSVDFMSTKSKPSHSPCHNLYHQFLLSTILLPTINHC